MFTFSTRQLLDLMETSSVISMLDPETINQLKAKGFNTNLVLWHGSKSIFSSFDLSKNVTAQHIYTSPCRKTAEAYGEHMYMLFGKTEPIADLIDDWNLINKIADIYADQFYDEYDVENDESLIAFREEHPENYDEMDEYNELLHNVAKQYTSEIIQSSQIYNKYGKFLQNSIMSECFAMGYRSVCFYDGSSAGEPISYVFHEPDDLYIIKRVK